MPALREELEIPVPADRGPGRAWKQGPALAVVPAPRTERPVRIGYARTSTARQELASRLEALRRAECHKVFHEQISTRIKVRPELEKALAPAHEFAGPRVQGGRSRDAGHLHRPRAQAPRARGSPGSAGLMSEIRQPGPRPCPILGACTPTPSAAYAPCSRRTPASTDGSSPPY
ncbi:recombinase family protein [Streptomyces sp. A3M-1-3]|uniref:recombinase family protein n=1 Tax=Streptomyces sp. A3M-1-3 TaxID=2962044 RepID=UPI0035ABBCD7